MQSSKRRRNSTSSTTADNRLSLYEDAPATDDDYRNAAQKLSIAFTFEDREAAGKFIALLMQRLKANGFTAARLRDAVNHVIDKFRFKTINIADVVDYDRTAKTYTYDEMCRLPASQQELCAPLTDARGDFVRLCGKLLWVDVHECMGTPVGERAMAWINARERERAERERAEQEEAARRGKTMSHEEWLAKKRLRDGG